MGQVKTKPPHFNAFQWRIYAGNGNIIRQDYANTIEGCQRYVEYHLTQQHKPYLCTCEIVAPSGKRYLRYTDRKGTVKWA